ncbi:hypothetical protein K439DRAFT_1546233 [Ramaria rubella]|nr:hypothetical protein K439DRAFT_1546233 [Ramaria rubella]
MHTPHSAFRLRVLAEVIYAHGPWLITRPRLNILDSLERNGAVQNRTEQHRQERIRQEQNRPEQNSTAHTKTAQQNGTPQNPKITPEPRSQATTHPPPRFKSNQFSNPKDISPIHAALHLQSGQTQVSVQIRPRLRHIITFVLAFGLGLSSGFWVLGLSSGFWVLGLSSVFCVLDFGLGPGFWVLNLAWTWHGLVLVMSPEFRMLSSGTYYEFGRDYVRYDSFFWFWAWVRSGSISSSDSDSDSSSEVTKHHPPQVQVQVQVRQPFIRQSHDPATRIPHPRSRTGRLVDTSWFQDPNPNPNPTSFYSLQAWRRPPELEFGEQNILNT